jgi:predicted amidohydrolase YtcJ
MCRIAVIALSLLLVTALRAEPDLILHNAKVVTVDRQFRVVEALAIEGEKITAVGSNEALLKLKGPKTKTIDLGGKVVLPGLIDSHTHPTGAAMHEFDHPIPDVETIADVLAYIKSRAKGLPEGEWIVVSQMFITRLKEQRYPTRQELDEAAPKNPVFYSTGPDASLSTLALKASGIVKGWKPNDGGTGFAEMDPTTGEPTGILRNCSRFVKPQTPSARHATEMDRVQRLLTLFADYNSVGITSIIDRGASTDGLARMKKLHDAGKLSVRVAGSVIIDTGGATEKVQAAIQKLAEHPLRQPDDWIHIIGVKIFLDGGMLTGSAYMREPWGISKIYSITDPQYRGVLFVSAEKLAAIVKTTVELGMQFTAHSVGDGAVHALLDAYVEVNKTTPVRKTRPCLTHSNFMSKEAVELLPKLGVVVDIQPAWLYLDAHTLLAQFGDERLRYFQPLRSIFESGGLAGGGSDHMQKIGSLRSVNPYDPWLGMWTTVTRKGKSMEKPLHPEEALTREQAIRFYTSNNAQLMFLEDKVGSLEPGKLADLIVIDRDILSCPVDDIRGTKVLRTFVGGKQVYEQK